MLDSPPRPPSVIPTTGSAAHHTDLRAMRPSSPARPPEEAPGTPRSAAGLRGRIGHRAGVKGAVVATRGQRRFCRLKGRWSNATKPNRSRAHTKVANLSLDLLETPQDSSLGTSGLRSLLPQDHVDSLAEAEWHRELPGGRTER